jgi:hypothetical protein
MVSGFGGVELEQPVRPATNRASEAATAIFRGVLFIDIGIPPLRAE